MRQMPRFDSQVSTERIFTFSMPPPRWRSPFPRRSAGRPATRMRGSPCSSSSCGSTTSSAATLPTMRSRSGSMMSSPSFSADDLEAQDGAAVLFGDRDVLRHVHEAAREVAGVGRLERGVGQTLTGAVRRDEVLEHREAFTEVRLDRALDDFADAAGELLLRLRHQAAHARQLTDLVARTTRAGVEHHEHRVEAAAATRACGSPSPRPRRCSRGSRRR